MAVRGFRESVGMAAKSPLLLFEDLLVLSLLELCKMLASVHSLLVVGSLTSTSSFITWVRVKLEFFQNYKK